MQCVGRLQILRYHNQALEDASTLRSIGGGCVLDLERYISLHKLIRPEHIENYMSVWSYYGGYTAEACSRLCGAQS